MPDDRNSVSKLQFKVITASLIVLILIWFGLKVFAEKAADEWTKDLRYSSVNDKKEPNQLRAEEAKRFQVYINSSLPNTTVEERDRLLQHLKEIECRARGHLNVTKAFYVYNYQSIALATLSSVIAAISTFLLSRKGWDNANQVLVIIFFISFSTAVITGTSPALFRHEANITDNRKVYLAYIALDDRLRSYVATKQFISIQPAETKSANKIVVNTVASSVNPALPIATQTLPLKDIKQIIQSVDGELATLNNIYIGFDERKIPNYNQVFKELPQSQ